MAGAAMFTLYLFFLAVANADETCQGGECPVAVNSLLQSGRKATGEIGTQAQMQDDAMKSQHDAAAEIADDQNANGKWGFDDLVNGANNAANTVTDTVNQITGTNCVNAILSDETCFGHQGSKCEKVNLAGIVSDSCPGNQQAVSVGSLAHDECCLTCTTGVGCSGVSIGSDLVTNMVDGVGSGDSKPCAYEWRKAWWNLLQNRSWCKTPLDSSYSGYMNKLNSDRTYTQTTSTGGVHATANVPWRKATWQPERTTTTGTIVGSLCADEGVQLDCAGCTPFGGRRRNGRIGDSDFCCFGYFDKVESVSGGDYNVNVGTCGGE